MGVTIAASRRAPRVLAAIAASVAVGLAVAPGAGAVSYAKGLDVSHWNGAVDWIQVVGGGYKFLFAKATEGTTLTDPTYSINRAGTTGLGLRFGAYHFARPAGSGTAGVVANAIAQADYFVNVAQPAAGDLPPVLDLETKGTLSPTSLVQWTQAWLGEVQARTGVSGLIYASPSFWKTALGDTSAFAGFRIPSLDRALDEERRADGARRPTGAGSAGRSGNGPTARRSRGSSTAATATG